MNDKISIKGARVHNLKDISLDIPKNACVVITGLSGSGKSSLAFDTLYAEGQRRYVESLSAYARQFLDRLDKPDVDTITGLSPAISIDQKSRSQNPRSTVGTVTEILDYLRLLYSSIGKPHCPSCGDFVSGQSAQHITDSVLSQFAGKSMLILSPVVSGKKGEHQDVFTSIKQDGFTRVRVNGDIIRCDDPVKLKKTQKHTIEIVVDRIEVNQSNKDRLFESIETGLRESSGRIIVHHLDDGIDHPYSEHFSCSSCDISFPEISPRLFSFNSPYGACEDCNGMGTNYDFDPDLIIENSDDNILDASNRILNLRDTIYGDRFVREGIAFGIDSTMRFKDLNAEQRSFFFYGSHEYTGVFKKNKRGRWMNIPRYWEGVINNLRRRYKQTNSEGMRFSFRRFMSSSTCSTCNGSRINKFANAVMIQNVSLAQLNEFSVSHALDFIENLSLSDKDKQISTLLLKEVLSRLLFLDQVGLSYLSLSRRANTLSGGESQRIRLATQIGSGLTGVLYVLDEPSIGLHQRDNDRLLETLKTLRNLGNTLVVVEHDEDTIRMADHVVEIGPQAGRGGGEICFSGNLKQFMKSNTMTAQYLNKVKQIEVPKIRRSISSVSKLTLQGVNKNNLKNVSLTIPLSRFVVVTGVSGSGKSSLIQGVLQPLLHAKLSKAKPPKDTSAILKGSEALEHLITIDQSPIGRTPRSNPVTYVGVFSAIRDLFSRTREAKIRGYKSGRFSFNVKGGRCEACQGDGVTKIEMHFLSDVYVTCDLCKGKRFNDQTLEVTFKGYTIYDVLEMTVNQACDVFKNIPTISKKLQTIQDVGLGYVKCGQSATTLSGGEAQRIKLAKELSKRGTGKTMYLLDEPTTGLHFDDIKKLLIVLNRLVDAGNSVLVIEHNLDVIKTADYVVDLGPEGGDKGGKIIVHGTPEKIIKNDASLTGQYLKPYLKS